MGAGEPQIESDVRDLIAGLERELVAANRHRLAIERHRVPEWFDRNERRLLTMLRRIAVVAAVIVAAVAGYLWTVDPLFGMAAIPVAPVVLLGIVLGCENVLRWLNYPGTRRVARSV